jgi:hypothetical protein
MEEHPSDPSTQEEWVKIQAPSGAIEEFILKVYQKL